MATNATADKTAVVDDDTTVTEEDLRKAKYGEDEVETSEEADETSEQESTEEESEETGEEDGQTDDSQDEESEDSESESDEETSDFVKQFPGITGDTKEEYLTNLELAYQNSTGEALRLKAELDKGTTVSESETTRETTERVDTSDPIALFMKQKMDEEISTAYGEFSKNFPQVTDQNEYNRFTNTVSQLSQTILNSEQRLASPKELYSKSAVILGWESANKVDDKDKLKAAFKDKVASGKTVSATKVSSKSKVTDQMISINRIMYPGKTDEEIREELEPYVK